MALELLASWCGLFLYGVRWKVRNGRNISFKTHKWVPFTYDFYIRSPLGPFRNCNIVANFIEDGEWNVSLLREHISATEAEMVMQIPISRIGSMDKLIWCFDPKVEHLLFEFSWTARFYQSFQKFVASISAQLNDFQKFVASGSTMSAPSVATDLDSTSQSIP
nr:F-box domain, FBD domain, leucine-rich repeat domain, L domain-like protein [Tanacetum cinerariifolium]